MNERKLEIKVGAFVLIGLIAIGILTVAFGRFGEMFSSNYQITVAFPNASGILKDSQVLYRGAKIGTVASRPEIINHGQAVELGLKIRSDIQIPSKSNFRIGSYGLLGDRFVDIVTPDQPSTTYFVNGQRVEKMQQNEKGFGDLAQQAQPIIKRLDDISAKIDQQLMNEDTVRNWQDSIANIKSVTARIDAFMAQAQSGQGTLYLLMNDKQTAADFKQTVQQLKDLSYNLKEHGILFYSDTAEKDAKAREKKK